MSKGSPSMIALLGILAVAGYQNRDKLSAMMQGGGGTGPDDRRNGDAGSDGSIIDNLRRMVSGAGAGGIAGGLSEIVGRFSKPDQAAKAQSWVDTGPNSNLAPVEMEEVLDEDTIAELTQKTGLSRDELLSRLSTALPQAVDGFTPEGRMPSPDEARGV